MGVIWTGNECGEKMHFKTKRCEDHVCIETAPHPGQKHRCSCEVTWTTDPELAGSNWSSEQVIFDGGKRVVDNRPPALGPNFPNNDHRQHKKNGDYN